MGFRESGLAANDQPFQIRVQACIFTVAHEVLAEPEDTSGHQLRAGLAQEVVFNPAQRVQQFTWLCATDPVVAATIKVSSGVVVDATDTQLATVCRARWNQVAGWRRSAVI